MGRNALVNIQNGSEPRLSPGTVLEEPGVFDGNRGLRGQHGEGLTVLRRKALSGLSVHDDQYAYELVAVDQRFGDDGSRSMSIVLDDGGMRIGRMLVIIDEQPCMPLGNRASDTFSQPEAHVDEPRTGVVPGTRAQRVRPLIPEIDHAPGRS